jgi:hypothetical protein
MYSFSPLTLSRLLRALLTLWLAVLGLAAHAAEVSVRASLSRGTAAIGDPVEYQIRITGASRVGVIPDVMVDGLEIRYTGHSNAMTAQMVGGRMVGERTLTLSYQVVAEKNGTFTIPAATIEADGKRYRTEPVGLTVQPNSASGATNDPQAIGFAEFVISKKSAYLGEAIPVELRLYIDARVQPWEMTMPEVGGEGFTRQPFPEPKRDQVQKNGRDYNVSIFKTVIAPSRAGKIVIGPSEMVFQARVPRARKNAPRSLFDLLDDDVLGSPYFSAVQKVKAKAEEVEIVVKPLPAAGKPAGFSGAVGNFQFAAEGSPKQVKIGDPVTMRLRVSGQGNFDRMSAPVLKDSAGWRTYPPSGAFKADDEIGYSGTKTFEMAVVPETRKTQMPVFQFSYFDPTKEKYVVLNSEASPLTVEAGSAPAPAVSPVPPVTTPDSPAAPAAVAARANDIVGLRYDRDAVRSFKPIHARPEFWWVQGGMAVVFLSFMALKLHRRPDAAVRAATELRREKAGAWARLRNAEMGHVEFLEAAAHVAQLETALAMGRSPASIDAVAVRTSARLSADAKAVIDEIFEARAELLYAGGGSAESAVSAGEKQRVLAALDELRRGNES